MPGDLTYSGFSKTDLCVGHLPSAELQRSLRHPEVIKTLLKVLLVAIPLSLLNLLTSTKDTEMRLWQNLG